MSAVVKEMEITVSGLVGMRKMIITCDDEEDYNDNCDDYKDKYWA